MPAGKRSSFSCWSCCSCTPAWFLFTYMLAWERVILFFLLLCDSVRGNIWTAHTLWRLTKTAIAHNSRHGQTVIKFFKKGSETKMTASVLGEKKRSKRIKRRWGSYVIFLLKVQTKFFFRGGGGGVNSTVYKKSQIFEVDLFLQLQTGKTTTTTTTKQTKQQQQRVKYKKTIKTMWKDLAFGCCQDGGMPDETG